jgi:hypothetical protein
MSNEHSVIYVMQKIDKIKQGCIIFCMLNLSACMFLPSSTTTHNQTQSLEKITSSSRASVEADIVKYKSFFDSVDTNILMVRVTTIPAGQFTTENEYFEEKTSHRDYYGNAFFSQLETQKDLFLSIYLSSDHDFTEYYRPVKHLELFRPIIYICGTSFKYNRLLLAIFPNDQPDAIDNEFHHIAQISIPILIDKGLISKEQKALCIYTAFFNPDLDLGGEHKKWVFNEVTIESFKIEALMKELKDKGIDYPYP